MCVFLCVCSSLPFSLLVHEYQPLHTLTRHCTSTDESALSYEVDWNIEKETRCMEDIEIGHVEGTYDQT
jgi:hypothetical protein